LRKLQIITKKQLELFKRNQNKWLEDQKNGKSDTKIKYVFVEDNMQNRTRKLSTGNNNELPRTPTTDKFFSEEDKKWKQKYDEENKTKRKLQTEVDSLNESIKILKKKIKKKKSGKKGGGNQDYERKILNLQKEIRILKRKLRVALLDIEKTANYYKKQLELFKRNQNKWLEDQKKWKKRH